MQNSTSKFSSAALVFVLLLVFNIILLVIYQNYESRIPSTVTISTALSPLAEVSNQSVDTLEQQANAYIVPDEKIQSERINEFKENHKHIVKNLSPKKFTYVVPDSGGYGNKMIQFISAMTVALLTDSALIVNVTDIGNYVQEPLYRCFRTEPFIDNELSYLYDKKSIYSFPKGTELTWRPKKSLKKLYKKIPTEYTRFIFEGMGPVYFELACNRDYFETFLHYGLVAPGTIKNALEVLEAKNLETSDQNLNILFRTGFELAHNIMRIFWKLNQSLEQEVDEYVRRHDFNGSFVVGMQLRFEFLSWEDSLKFIECAKYVDVVVNSSGKASKWFITSDNEHYLKKIKEAYPEKVIHTDRVITHVAGNPSGYARAMVDVELLSRCDELVITGGSTFGFVSAMRSGRYPLFVNGRKNQTCQRFSFGNPSENPSGYAVVK